MSADDAARGQLWHGRFDVSPAEDARAIAAAAPHGTFTVTAGTPHADLGVPGA